MVAPGTSIDRKDGFTDAKGERVRRRSFLARVLALALAGSPAWASGCTNVSRRPPPADPAEVAAHETADPTAPELAVTGTYDEVSGSVTLSVTAAFALPAPPPRRYEECESTSWWPAWAFTGIPGVILMGVGADTVAGADSSTFEGLGEGIGGVLTVALGAGLAGIGLVFVVVDVIDTPDCRVVAEAAPPGRPAQAAPAPVGLFLVRIVRPNGRQVVTEGAGGTVTVPLEPALFECPPDCLATAERRGTSGGSAFQVEELIVEVSAPQLARPGAPAPSVSATVAVHLVPTIRVRPPLFDSPPAP